MNCIIKNINCIFNNNKSILTVNMWTQGSVRVVRRVHFAVVQVQYITNVETRRPRLTARHFYTVQKSETQEKTNKNKFYDGVQ